MPDTDRTGYEGPPLALLMEVIGTLIEKYEDEHLPEPGT